MTISADSPLVLATDLDGTFLGGSTRDRAELYRYIQRHRSDIVLIFLTGRDRRAVQAVFVDESVPIPVPDYIVYDVGTQIVDGRSLAPVVDLQSWIDRRWNNANQQIIQLLANEPGIELRPVITKNRVSYAYQPTEINNSVLEKIAQAGFDYILSDDTYLDVLPKGISKGPTLLRLIRTLGCGHDNVVCCGDTLNDLSLFTTGLKGVVVGNAEQKLIAQTQKMINVYHSKFPGARGIWEGLIHYQKHREPMVAL